MEGIERKRVQSQLQRSSKQSQWQIQKSVGLEALKNDHSALKFLRVTGADDCSPFQNID